MTDLDAHYYPFRQKPLSDTCWSLSTGPDRRVYAAACCEHTGGQSVAVMRYDRAADDFVMLFDVGEVTDDPPDSGRATQCKIHYSFAPSPATGLLYCATHLSGPPIGETRYCPWSGWHDARRAFRGAMLVAYDTRADTVAWSKLMIPREGCRCLVLDEARGFLYAITYPRDHFVRYDLARHTLADFGRIGSVNSQCLFTDRRGRVLFTDEEGRFLRFDPETEAFATLPWVYPTDPARRPWHGVLYDAAEDAAGDSVFLLPWNARPRLARFWPDDGPHGRLEDWGPVHPEPRDETYPMDFGFDHAGGLVLGADQAMYFVRAVPDAHLGRPRAWRKGELPPEGQAPGEVIRVDEANRRLEAVGRLPRGEGMRSSRYVARGARDAEGDLFFAHVGAIPTGAYRVRLPAARSASPDFPLRMWG